MPVVCPTDARLCVAYCVVVTQTPSSDKLTVNPATGALVALEIALPAGLAALVAIFVILSVTGGTVTLGDPSAAVTGVSGWLALCCLAACIAASIITSLTNRKSLNRPARIVLLAMLTRLLAWFLMPVVLAIWSAPDAMNGGAMPCFHIDNTCQSGLHGLDAIGGLVAAAGSWYAVGIFVILPGLIDVLLVIPAAIWDKLMLSRANASAYQRSV